MICFPICFPICFWSQEAVELERYKIGIAVISIAVLMSNATTEKCMADQGCLLAAF